MKKKMNEIYIGLGSNIGDRKRNILHALSMLKSQPEIHSNMVSSLYESSPVGPKQRRFFNAAAKITTTLSPNRLLRSLKSIEKRLGRKKIVRRGPRAIDLDILFYGRKKIRTRSLTVPHSEFHRRKFVLRPLKEIAPHFKPPGFSRTISQILVKLTDPGQKVRLIRTCRK